MSNFVLAAAVGLIVSAIALVVARLRERKHRAMRDETLATRARLQATLAGGGISTLAVGRDGHIRWFEGSPLPGAAGATATTGTTGATSAGRAALLGRSAWDALATWPGLVAALRSGLGGQRGVSRIGIGEHALEVHYAPRFDDRGTVEEAVAMVRDVTAEQAEAERAERLADVRTRILGVMSYRLRGQLHSIVAATQLAATADMAGHDDHVEAQRWLSSVDGASQRLLSYVEHLVDFLELDAGRVTPTAQPFSLRRAIDELAEAYRAQAATDGTTFIVRYPRQLADQFDGDGTRIAQAVDLLLTVAMGTNQGGQVVLNVDTAPAEAGAALVTVSVEDNGRGLSADARTRIFDAFDSASALWATRSGNSGLELPLAQRLVRMLGGTLEVDSTPGEGTALRLTLLLPKAWAGSTAPAAPEEIPREPGTLLLIDDDRLQRQTTRALATSLGWTVIEAGHGGEALKLLEGGQAVDCVVTELHMPVCDGIGLLTTMRSRTDLARLPVAVLTADSREASRDLAMRRGARTYAVKPLRLDELASLLNGLRPAQARLETAHPEAPVLDSAWLERLSAIDPVEGPAVAQELASALVAALPLQMIQLADAIRDGHESTVSSVLASLEVSARLVGATRLTAALEGMRATPLGDERLRRDAYERLARETQLARNALLNLDLEVTSGAPLVMAA